MKRLKGRAKNQGTRKNVLVALEQCQDFLGISPETVQGEETTYCKSEVEHCYKTKKPEERNVVSSCDTSAGNCIPYIDWGDPMVIAILQSGGASATLQEI